MGGGRPNIFPQGQLRRHRVLLSFAFQFSKDKEKHEVARWSVIDQLVD